MITICCIEITPPIVNIIGLIFDIIGAWLVASEVVSQYKGTLTKPIGLDNNGTEKHPEFEKWEFKKYYKMKLGLGCLIIGFLLQIIANLMTWYLSGKP